MERFANLLHDETFKIVVGAPGNESLVIKLIELLIPGKKIRELVNLDKENHGLVISDKRLKEIERWDSEIDETGEESGNKSNKMDYGLHPIYVISLLNFRLPHEREEALEEGMISRYSIRNDRDGELMTEALHFIFLELGRLGVMRKDYTKCLTPLQKLAYSLKYMHQLEAVPKGFDDEFLRMLYKAGELAGMTQEQRRQYDRAMTTKIDIIAQQEYARKEGLAEGRAEGRAEAVSSIQANLKSKGFSSEEIAEIVKIK